MGAIDTGDICHGERSGSTNQSAEIGVRLWSVMVRNDFPSTE